MLYVYTHTKYMNIRYIDKKKPLPDEITLHKVKQSNDISPCVTNEE